MVLQKDFDLRVSFQQSAQFVPIRFQIYLCSISIAHLAEYLFVASFHTSELKWDSFLINQSKHYILAHCIAVNEYAWEYYFAPELEILEGVAMLLRSLTLVIGLSLIFVGHFFRIAAMFTAARSFHHLVQYEKKNSHVLVTSGVYSWVRHPSYFGWFLWCIGTQVILINPISYLGFYYASTHFFIDRIPDEEYSLCEFFGDDYIDYALRTPILIPKVQAASALKFQCFGFRRPNKKKD